MLPKLVQHIQGCKLGAFPLHFWDGTFLGIFGHNCFLCVICRSPSSQIATSCYKAMAVVPVQLSHRLNGTCV